MAGTHSKQVRSFAPYQGIALLAIGETLIWASLFYVFPALLVRWEAALNWSKSGLTGAITVALFSSAMVSPLIGRLIDNGHGPRLLGAGAALGGICLWMLSLVSSLWQFYLLWAGIGACMAACLYEPCFMLITRAYGPDAKRYIIAVTLVAGFAGTLCFPVSHLIAERYDWRVVLWCFSVVAVGIASPLLYFGAAITESHADKTTIRSGSRQPAASWLDNPVLLKLGIGFAVIAIVHGATLHHLLAVLKDRGISINSAVFVASLIGPMQVLGRLLVTAFQNKLTHVKIARGCFLFIGLSMVLLFMSTYGLSVAVLFAIAFGGSYGVVSIIRPVIARDLLGDADFGAKSGKLALLYLTGAAISPYIGSLIWFQGGYDLMIAVLVLVTLVGFYLVHSVTRPQAAADRNDENV